ncbi:hypothetical protein [Nocardioides insulae]|uniref:hypothetical protein n=1 Tax=Nocardioides insulae TaxID=394734 RepID=UPI0004109A2B|nr:hypothetical protein [Nocardioides insulae]
MQTKKPRLALLSGALAAAVVFVALGYALFAMFGDDDAAGDDASQTSADGSSASPSESGSASPSAPSSADTSAPAVTTLAFPAAGGRCLVPTSEALAAKDLALAGTVVSVDGDQATVETTDVYAGTVGDTVAVAMPGAAAFEGDFSLEEGQDYLLAADDEGTLTVCGFSGPVSPQLQKLYDAAFN